MKQFKMFQGMRTFAIVWVGQFISTIGSGLTGFALGVWIYQETGSTTLFALNLLAYALPSLFLSPIAGALADRWDRRLLMMLSDTGAGLSTLMIAILAFTNHLEVWHIYLATAINSGCSAFQWPAYSAATTLLAPKDQLGRAAGMVQIGEAISQLLAPAIAGAMLVAIGLQGVIIVDFVTFLCAILTLSFVRFPKPTITAEGIAGRGSIWQEAGYGWRYISARPGLLGLLVIFALSNFLFGLMSPLLTPLILEIADAQVLGLLSSLMGAGMLVGTLVMSAWGGPKWRIHGVLAGMAVMGGFILLFGLRPWIPLMGLAGFGAMLMNPIVNASSQALWQSKVAVDVQGRVFAVRRMISWSVMPLAYVIAGPLADNLFNPLLVEGGVLAESLIGRIFGIGAGRGIGLMISVIGLLSIIVALSGYLYPRIRLVEDELPDAVNDLDENY
jgi:MFS family permease